MKRKFVVIADTQAPYELPQCVALACEYIRLLKLGPEDLVCLNGDICDFFTVSDYKRIGAPYKLLKDEIAHTINEVILPIKKVSGEARILWNEGNHEYRLKRYIAYNAAVLEGIAGLDIQDLFKMRELGITYNGSKAGNGIFKITSELTLMHGNKGGQNPAKAQYQMWGGSLIMGHSHKEDTHRRKHGAGPDHVALCSGCLCEAPDFMDIDNYTRGFIAGWYDDETGEFQADHKRISGEHYATLYCEFGRLDAVVKGRDRGRKHWTVRRHRGV